MIMIRSDIIMTIGDTIKRLRQEQGITQEQLAEALGITSRAVSQWECARTAPDISQLPALANFFDVTTDRLLGVDISRKEDAVRKIQKQVQKMNQNGEQASVIEYLREQLKIYPNEPGLLTHLASALQSFYFYQGKADTDDLKKEKSGEIISLCERALKYYKPTEDNSFPKQLLIYQYEFMNEKEKAREIIMSLPYAACTRDMLEADVLEGKEALKRRQSALLNSFTQIMHVLFWKICQDDSYSYEEKIEILKADAAMIDLMTGGRPNVFHGALSMNAVTQALCFSQLGDEGKALDMIEAAHRHTDRYENRPDGGKYAPCWLSELDDKREYTAKTSPDTAYESVYHFIIKPENQFCEVFDGNERFERLLEKLKGKSSI